MQYLVCTIYDKQTETYGKPFTARTEGDATRMVGHEVNSPQGGLLNTHPADYSLQTIGMWDDETGEIIAGRHVKILDLNALKTEK